MDTGILAAVGAKARNNDIDVETIQKLLNRVGPPVGAPSPLLDEDGDCGPLTIAAINRFQQRALGFNDGVIEPNRNTHRKLAELAGSAPAESPSRVELANGLVPLVQPMVLGAIAALEVLRKNPTEPGLSSDRAREALKVHFLLDDLREDRIGRVIHRFQGIRVEFDHRNLFWRSATTRQAKIELNQRVTARVPAIYNSLKTLASTVFTPNFKALNPKDRLGYGPQMLGYRLITGVALRVLSVGPNDSLLESDTPGFPGSDFEAAVVNPASYGSFAFHIRLGFAQPLGERMRGI